jgi:hypothetical protein
MRPEAARTILEAAWREPGFCVPHAGTYPFQWLWDSCFHAVVWAELGDRRALVELDRVLANRSPAGFVPHLTYWADPGHHEGFWGRPLTSCITQPPMYGHAVAVCARRGWPVDDLVGPAEAGLRFLLTRRRRTDDGLVVVVHPWETGCDDSLRWDDWLVGEEEPLDWYTVKGDLVRAVELDAAGDPVSSRRFAVGSVGFNALLAWNVRELASIGAACDLHPLADELVTGLSARWAPGRRSWLDAPDGSGAARTLDALLALLVDPRPEAWAELSDPTAFDAPFGPRGAHPDEPAYRPDRYWRGPAWPQLTYLLALAARAAGRDADARRLGRALIRGAEASGAAEYWHPDTGEGFGARPQTWTTLALVASEWERSAAGG